jgi:hypothetical protein
LDRVKSTGEMIRTMQQRGRLISVLLRRSFSSSSSAASTASASKRRFSPPPNNPAGFLAELKSFAAATRSSTAEGLERQLPISFSGDVAAVLDGKRRIVTSDSAFNFACTGCGACCKSAPRDVMLDSHDIWNISRADGLHSAADSSSTTTSLYAAYPKAFVRKLGIFESAEHLIETDDETRGWIASARKLVPVVFLHPKRVKQVVTTPSNGGQKPQQKSAVEDRCWFAYTSAMKKVELEQDEQAESTDAKVPTIARPPSRSAGASSTSKGLRCRLGPSNMPTTCALYPLGELYSTPAAASAPSGAASSSRYYTLDVNGCEGTHVFKTSATSLTVGDYSARNHLDARRSEWEWFQRRAQKLALIAARMPSPAVLDEFHSVAHTILYDFDSLAGHPMAGVQDWREARAKLDGMLDQLESTTESFLQAGMSTSAATAAWRAELESAGLSR